MYSTYMLNKQGDNIQPWRTSFLIWNVKSSGPWKASLWTKLVEVMEFQLRYLKSWKMMVWKCCTQYASKFRKLKWMVPLAKLHVQERHGLCFIVKIGPYVVLCNQSGHQAVPNLDRVVGWVFQSGKSLALPQCWSLDLVAQSCWPGCLIKWGFSSCAPQLAESEDLCSAVGLYHWLGFPVG